MSKKRIRIERLLGISGAVALFAAFGDGIAHGATFLIERHFTGLSQAIPDGHALVNARSIDAGDVTIEHLRVHLTIAGVSATDPAFNGDYFVSLAHEHGGYAVLANRVGRATTTGLGAFGYDDNGFRVVFDDHAAHDIHWYRDVWQSPLPGAATPVTGTWQPSGRVALPHEVTGATDRTAFLDSFAGTAASGLWWLTVEDTSWGGSGVLESWGVTMRVSTGEGGALRLTEGDRVDVTERLVLSGPVELGGTATFSGSHDVELTGNLRGGGNLVFQGSGTLVLSEGSDEFLGNVEVASGRLRVVNREGSATGSGSVAVIGEGTVSGTGRIGGNLLVAQGGTLAPGESPGALTVSDLEWGSGGSYQWEINLAHGMAGEDPGWDLIVVENQLAVTATESDPFVIQLISLQSDNTPGPLDGFQSTQSQSWLIASVGTVTGFSPGTVLLDETGFWQFNQQANGWHLTLSAAEGGIYLNYIPEFRFYGFFAGILGLIAALAFRRRAGKASIPR